MTKEQQVDIKQVYADYAKSGLDSAQQLGWNNMETQARYMTIMTDFLAKHFPLKSMMVHDAGCGYGDLIPYLRKHGVAGYVGTDLMQSTIDEAKKSRPDVDFRCVDLLREDVPKAQLTICMGGLAFHRAEQAMELLERLWAASSRALAFNCWWNLTPQYQHYWETQKLQKRVESWLKRKEASMLQGYDPTEAMFVVWKPVVEKKA